MSIDHSEPGLIQEQKLPLKSQLDSETPSDSHALASADHEIKGAAQQPTKHTPHKAVDADVKDLGWTDRTTTENVPNPLIGGLPNDKLWTLVRRFNKQMYHVKATDTPPPGGLDLVIADEEEFSSDKLRSNLERVYMTIGLGLITLVKHVARLRSWRETRRTAIFCAVYFFAWTFDLVPPVLLSWIIVLILSPKARAIMFPPAPLALVDSKDGGLQKPKAGMLGTSDTLTGAPEMHAGEAVEQEASNFVSSMAAISLSSALGKHPERNKQQEEGGSIDGAVPDPEAIVTVPPTGTVTSVDGTPLKGHDKTKKPLEEMMWEGVRPFMRILADLADTWERFANALSPSAPFPKYAGRLRLASVIIPALLASFYITPYMIFKGATFAIGCGFFGDPIMSRGLYWLNMNYPRWPKLLEVRNTFLKGMPTNAQLTVTLLRIGEANHAPLPPPPQSRANTPPPSDTSEVPDVEELQLDATQEELDAAVNPDPESDLHTESTEYDKDGKKHGGKVLKLVKSTMKAGVSTILGTDKIKATVGSTHAKHRLGIVPKPKDLLPPIPAPGPVVFQARWEGKKGAVVISTAATPPCVGFAYTPSKIAQQVNTLRGKAKSVEEAEDSQDLVLSHGLTPQWSIPISEIKELKKVGGLGWKGRIVVSWVLGTEVKDALEIVNAQGDRKILTAVQLREELFNRLVSMGPQRWESW